VWRNISGVVRGWLGGGGDGSTPLKEQLTGTVLREGGIGRVRPFVSNRWAERGVGRTLNLHGNPDGRVNSPSGGTQEEGGEDGEQ